ncbi:MAG: MFS transporter [Rhodobacter sp.]|uniref:MFS transporter n=1 Tax=Pararhodobacter sp. TaxID=2127056 RepID=UPI001D8698A6|nr:MFS transporter [Pararhodobacter sp.]MCB1346330.1 MFS transporter [Paracoccaceae bacterium]MCC0072458.1 MFS transporter [Rhodobacter sp.]HPD91288.1 MFS transporter [Pararhodobacter sp.]
MTLLISFAALFASVFLLQLGLGGVVPLDALSGTALGFTAEQIGAMGSAHFLGFFIGCWWAPRLMGTVGHSRAFAAFAAAGTIGIMAHMMWVDPWAWALMRMASGLAVAGCYTIIEAWLQSKVTNQTRGRAMGVYRMVDVSGNLGAQVMIAFLTPAAYVSYNLLALFMCAALFPLLLTRAEAPAAGEAPRLRPRLAWDKSPLGAVGVVVSGITGAAFRMVGPLYGIAVGLEADRIALFLSAYVVGGALAQFPIGWVADKFDRRKVLIGISVASILGCGAMVAGAQGNIVTIFLAAGFFGFTTFPIYSISTAHAHDFAEQHERVELSAAQMFLYAVGAIASPVIASALISAFGPSSMFVFIALAHVLLIVFGLVRMQMRPAPETRTAYVYTPRTSFLIGRLLRRPRQD